MSTLHTYFYRRILVTVSAILGGLALIGLLCQLILALADRRLSGLDTIDFLIYMSLKLPQIITVVLPFGVFIGTLVALDIARSDNEIACCHASGVSFWTMAGIGMPPAVLVAGIQAVMYFYAVPSCRIASIDLVYANAAKAMSGVVSDTFVSPLPGLTLRYDRIAGNAYSGVFANFDDGSTDTTYVARKAVLNNDPDDLSLVMYDGAIISYGGAEASGVLSFDQYTLSLSALIEDNPLTASGTDSMYIQDLLAAPAGELGTEAVSALRSEGHFRISTPLLTPFLSLLAGLAVVGGRASRGRYPLRLALFCLVGVVVVIAPHIATELVQRAAGRLWIYYAQPVLLAAGLICTHLTASSNKPRV